MDTLDRLLLGDDVVDVLKIHAQGSDIDVLRGAQKALSLGRVCVVHVMSGSLRIGQMEKVSSLQALEALAEVFRRSPPS